MKRIVYHYVVMRTLEVPDECPSGSIDEVVDWIERQTAHSCFMVGDTVKDYTIKENTRDCEIVDVRENI